MLRSLPVLPATVLRLAPLVGALATCGWVHAAQSLPGAVNEAPAATSAATSPATGLKTSRQLDWGRTAPGRPALVLSAQQLRSQLLLQTQAQGEVELRYGRMLLRSDRLEYDEVTDLATASGSVQLSQDGNTVRGPSLAIYLDRFEGEFLNPQYFFAQTGAGGRAAKLQFLDANHVRALDARYSSCTVDDERSVPGWELSTSDLTLDFENHQGVAKQAVLRFLGVPILAAPSLSFPLGDERKSGWLPPNIDWDVRSGLELGVPYYWNIAPQRDATFTPFIMTRRGSGVDSEFRYLEPQHRGQFNLALLPHDRLTGQRRWAARIDQQGSLGMAGRYLWRAERVSDDDYWKDLPRRLTSQTPRLLGSDFRWQRDWSQPWGDVQAYGRVQRWQPLQGADLSTRFRSPYQRSPQLGVRMNTQADDLVLAGYRPWGRRARLEGGFELEYNRFDLPSSALSTQTQTGTRLHGLAHVSLPMGTSAWWLIPKASVNAASYHLDQPLADGARSTSRTVPTFSVDHGWMFERSTVLWGRDMVQTLEPRALYVNTPYRAQERLPMFDSAAKDFNFDSIYAENQFTGVDRVSDAHQLTLGATTRWVESERGEELLRLGLVQKVLFRDQRITPDGQGANRKVSDLLLLGSSHLLRHWWMDAALQYNPDSSRVVRTLMGVRYTPGDFKSVSAAYRQARGQSEQVEVAWQWPLFGHSARERGQGARSGKCSGAWYSAGRVQYSLRDRKFTDSVAGVEYDAGCWILRMGAERLSTGRAETNTRWMLQLELVGLSQLGPNALKVLRDNVPGYRPLSNDRSASHEASYD